MYFSERYYIGIVTKISYLSAGRSDNLSIQPEVGV
jgi:hypothetical protein